MARVMFALVVLLVAGGVVGLTVLARHWVYGRHAVAHYDDANFPSADQLKTPKSGSRDGAQDASGDLAAADAGEAVRVANYPPEGQLATATFGSGCFWCGEAVFEQLAGVASVESGYSGGDTKDPTYYEVVRGNTGHAEVFQVRYDPQVISYPKLLEVFWRTHDPTTPNRQGNDVGPQYRSIILYHDEEQRRLAASYLEELDKSGAFRNPIVTEIKEFETFYPAEADHQDFYRRNKRNRYCRYVIVPKLKKLEQVFAEQLKPAE